MKKKMNTIILLTLLVYLRSDYIRDICFGSLYNHGIIINHFGYYALSTVIKNYVKRCDGINLLFYNAIFSEVLLCYTSQNVCFTWKACEWYEKICIQ